MENEDLNAQRTPIENSLTPTRTLRQVQLNVAPVGQTPVSTRRSSNQSTNSTLAMVAPLIPTYDGTGSVRTFLAIVENIADMEC